MNWGFPSLEAHSTNPRHSHFLVIVEGVFIMVFVNDFFSHSEVML